MASQNLQNRNLKTHGTPRNKLIYHHSLSQAPRGSISHVSPLARAMFGKRVGDLVRAGNGNAEILGIS
jgi:transcription elongation GreA/GreB family factor